MSKGWSGGSDTRWRRLRLAVLERDQWTCKLALPGCTSKAEHVDHLIPLSIGGQKYDPHNCRAACQHCNLSRRTTAKQQHEPEPKRVSRW